MPNTPWSHSPSASASDDVDFEIKGQELQFLEIELDPGESTVAEAGSMVWKDASVEITTCSATAAVAKAAASWASCSVRSASEPQH
jgi:uncharacterized protein (AIM24 family)